jgi:hypothetical protein
MGDWLIDATSAPGRVFPRVRHRHPNGTLDAVRDRTPTRHEPLGGAKVERWSYACACGEIWVWERKAD